jgi:hypothetical protein
VPGAVGRVVRVRVGGPGRGRSRRTALCRTPCRPSVARVPAAPAAPGGTHGAPHALRGRRRRGARDAPGPHRGLPTRPARGAHTRPRPHTHTPGAGRTLRQRPGAAAGPRGTGILACPPGPHLSRSALSSRRTLQARGHTHTAAAGHCCGVQVAIAAGSSAPFSQPGTAPHHPPTHAAACIRSSSPLVVVAVLRPPPVIRCMRRMLLWYYGGFWAPAATRPLRTQRRLRQPSRRHPPRYR